MNLEAEISNAENAFQESVTTLVVAFKKIHTHVKGAVDQALPHSPILLHRFGVELHYWVILIVLCWIEQKRIKKIRKDWFKATVEPVVQGLQTSITELSTTVTKEIPPINCEVFNQETHKEIQNHVAAAVKEVVNSHQVSHGNVVAILNARLKTLAHAHP